MIVSILNQKGGSGKTTIAINLARAMKIFYSEKVLLIDSDPQGSARDWNAAAKGKLLSVIGLDKPSLDKDIKPFIYDYDWIFIDGAPAISSLAVSAVKCSNIILIPVQPSPYDLWATEDLLTLVSEKIACSSDPVKAALVVSRQIPNTIIGKEIRDILRQYKVSHGIDTFNAGTMQRVIYSTSAAAGSTVLDVKDRDASREIMALTKELRAMA